MRAIKAVVIIMGILLVAGLGLVGYGLASKAHQLSPGPAQAIPAPAAPDTVVGQFGTISVPMPPGARIEQMEAAAGRIVLRLTEGERQSLLVLDPATGKTAGTIQLVPQP